MIAEYSLLSSDYWLGMFHRQTLHLHHFWFHKLVKFLLSIVYQKLLITSRNLSKTCDMVKDFYLDLSRKVIKIIQ